MDKFFLTEGEVKQITDRTGAEDQAQALRAKGIPHIYNGRSKPKVVREVYYRVEVSRATQPKAANNVPTGMNLSAISG